MSGYIIVGMDRMGWDGMRGVKKERRREDALEYETGEMNKKG